MFKWLKPKSVLLANDKQTCAQLLVHGQGVILFQCSYSDLCLIQFHNKDKTNQLRVQFTPINVFAIQNVEPLIDTSNQRGLCNQQGAYYWISLDSQNQRLFAGIGEARIENIIYEYSWTFSTKDAKTTNKTFLESLRYVSWHHTVSPSVLLRDPITQFVPMKVVHTDEITLDQIDGSDVVPHSFLSCVGKDLYDCISGKQFRLDDDEFPEFSQAIEHSIRTPGLWCYETLQAKASDFNKEKPSIQETYLRITLNANNGESPGIPFVMEIWPPTHFSPVHNHGGSHAIIRVLHGSIHVRLYPFLSQDTVQPCAEMDFNTNEVTWITPTLNQVHQLENLDANTTCITIQCYMYDENNLQHYDYFDYLDGHNEIQQFEPDSDMQFTEFKQLMKKEWTQFQLSQQLQIDTIEKFTRVYQRPVTKQFKF